MIFPDNIEKENEPGDTKQTKENLKHFTTDVIKIKNVSANRAFLEMNLPTSKLKGQGLWFD